MVDGRYSVGQQISCHFLLFLFPLFTFLFLLLFICLKYLDSSNVCLFGSKSADETFGANVKYMWFETKALTDTVFTPSLFCFVLFCFVFHQLSMFIFVLLLRYLTYL